MLGFGEDVVIESELVEGAKPVYAVVDDSVSVVNDSVPVVDVPESAVLGYGEEVNSESLSVRLVITGSAEGTDVIVEVSVFEVLGLIDDVVKSV